MALHNVIFSPAAIRNRVQYLIAAGWHPADHGIRKHAIWTLGVDFARAGGFWPCKVDVDVTARRATLN